MPHQIIAVLEAEAQEQPLHCRVAVVAHVVVFFELSSKAQMRLIHMQSAVGVLAERWVQVAPQVVPVGLAISRSFHTSTEDNL